MSDLETTSVPSPSVPAEKDPVMAAVDRVKLRQAKNLAKQKERYEKKKAAKQARKLSELAAFVEEQKNKPVESIVPAQLADHLWKPGESGNPAGRPKTKYTRDAIIKVIADVQAIDKNDPNVSTRWQKLMGSLYERALSPDTKTADLMLIMNFLAERLDGKSAADVEDGSEKPALTININATRFGMQSTEKGEVINVNPV